MIIIVNDNDILIDLSIYNNECAAVALSTHWCIRTILICRHIYMYMYSMCIVYTLAVSALYSVWLRCTLIYVTFRACTESKLNDWMHFDLNIISNENTHFSNPLNASDSMTLILFSYSVNISNVSNPSNARLWICEMRLWFKFNISKWWRFLIAFDGTFCSWFCDTSNWVSSLPEWTKKNNNKMIDK